jgi:hypothetical protein
MKALDILEGEFCSDVLYENIKCIQFNCNKFI